MSFAHRIFDVELAYVRDTGLGIESGGVSCGALDRCELPRTAENVSDPGRRNFPCRCALNNSFVADNNLVAVFHEIFKGGRGASPAVRYVRGASLPYLLDLDPVDERHVAAGQVVVQREHPHDVVRHVTDVDTL